MKFCKLLRYDLKCGIGNHVWKYLTLIPLVLLCCYWTQMDYLREGITRFTGTDLIVTVWGGMNEYIPAPDRKFEFPIVWMGMQVLFLFFVLNYCTGDLESFGSHRLVKGKSRSLWWLSKCCWLLVDTVLFYTVAYLCIVLFCAIQHAGVWGVPSQEILVLFSKLSENLADLNHYPVLFYWIAPILFSMTIGFFQMLLSILWKPILAFLISMILLVAALYYNSGMIPLNQVMLLRTDLIIGDGYAIQIGFGVCMGIIGLSVVAGNIYMGSKNILPREE